VDGSEHLRVDQTKTCVAPDTGCLELRRGGVTVLDAKDGKSLRCEIRHDDLHVNVSSLEEVSANLPSQAIHFHTSVSSPPWVARNTRMRLGGTQTLGMGLATVLRMRTRLTDLLDIEHPIMLAGMGGVSYHRLVAAVSEAGGIGTLGASTMSAEELPREIAAVRELTSKPFGVDLLTALPGQVERGIQAVIDGGAKIFVAGLGVPREVIDLLHTKSILVGSMCGKVRHALSAVASGVDFVVAQGTEAGGHTGTVATIALVPQVVDAVGAQVPVIAAGGLFDGRGLAASLALGADGVWIGTRFIATPEARAVNGYKDALLATAEDGTVVSRSYTGKTCRVVRNDWTNHYDTHPDELQPFPAQAIASAKAGVNHLGFPDGTEVDATREFMPCGQGVGAIDSLIPAAELLRSMVAEAEATIERLMGARR
jgi:enoyl-[acyl-carrier protein] reductase II